MNLPHALTISALALAALAGCGDGGNSSSHLHAAVAAAKAADPTTPGGAMAIALADLKTGDFTSFFSRVTPAKQLAQMESQWKKFCSKDMSIDDAAEFNEVLRSMTLNGSELLLFEKVKPRLDQAQQQVQALASMGPMLAAGALSEMDVEAEKGLAAMQTMAAAFGDIDIASEKKAKRAIGIACKAARAMRVANAHAFQRLSFEEAFGRLDVLFVAVMDLMDVYGVSLRASIYSMKAREIAVEGDTAYMELTMTMFGQPTEPIPFEMVRVNGRWEISAEKQVAE